MTLASTGITFWPMTQFGHGQLSSSFASNVLTFDSANDRLAWVGQSWLSDSIAKVHFRTGTVTSGPVVNVRIEGVTNGRPSGVLLDLNTSGTVTVSGANTWQTTTLTAAASVSIGTLFAVVITYSSGTANFQIRCGSTTAIGGRYTHYPLLLQDTGGGTWAAPSTVAPFEMIVEMTTAGPVYFSGMIPLDGDWTTTAYNSGSSPDEVALRFVPTAKMRCVGLVVTMANIAAGADFTCSLWPSSSTTDGDALVQVAVDGDSTISATVDGMMEIYFGTAVTLSAGTTYYAGVRADTANNITVVRGAAPSGITGSIKAWGLPDTNSYQATRTWTAGSAGAWTTATSTLPHIQLIVDQWDDGAGAGGLAANPRAGYVG